MRRYASTVTTLAKTKPLVNAPSGTRSKEHTLRHVLQRADQKQRQGGKAEHPIAQSEASGPQRDRLHTPCNAEKGSTPLSESTQTNDKHYEASYAPVQSQIHPDRRRHPGNPAPLQGMQATTIKLTGNYSWNYEGIAVGPYLASLNGAPDLSVFCLDLHISTGVQTTYTGGLTTPSTEAEEEAAFLASYSLYLGVPSSLPTIVNNVEGPISLAIWQLMGPWATPSPIRPRHHTFSWRSTPTPTA